MHTQIFRIYFKREMVYIHQVPRTKQKYNLQDRIALSDIWIQVHA